MKEQIPGDDIENAYGLHVWKGNTVNICYLPVSVLLPHCFFE